MAVEGKRFNWVRSPGAWESVQTWREKRAAMRANFEASSADAVSRFGAALTAQTSGSATIAGQTALDRINAAVKARLDKSA
jgi:hypothetical protein